MASIDGQKCPEGAVCITLGDQLVLWHREADLDRMHEILQGCPRVHFTETVAPTTDR